MRHEPPMGAGMAKRGTEDCERFLGAKLKVYPKKNMIDSLAPAPLLLGDG